MWSVLRLLNRQAELEQLIAWAERKRLAGPLRCYTFHLRDTERLLFRYRVNNSAAVHGAMWLYRLRRALFPPPRYLTHGAARGYARSGCVRGRRSCSLARVIRGFRRTFPAGIADLPDHHLSRGGLERRYAWE